MAAIDCAASCAEEIKSKMVLSEESSGQSITGYCRQYEINKGLNN
jgi:hypothetical protein